MNASIGRGRHSEQTDETLVAQAQSELPFRTEAFDALVQRHYESVRRLAAGMMGSPDDADAVAQDVMLRVFSALQSFRGDAKFTTWLYRIVENLCRTRMRQAQREAQKRQAYYEASDGAADDGVAGDEFGTLVRALSLDERTIMAFRFLEDMELNEIADVLGIGLSAVKMRYYRALEKLKRDLEAQPAD